MVQNEVVAASDMQEKHRSDRRLLLKNIFYTLNWKQGN